MAKLKPTKVYIASPVCDAKSYTQAVLSQCAFEVTAFKDTAPPEMATVPRIAKVREEIRQAFLKSDCTHLYFHDADMIPPADIVERLLAHDRDIASGLYVHRVFCEAVSPILLRIEQGRQGVEIDVQGTFTNDSLQEVLGCGMGCMLIRRSVLEKVGFREPSEYTADTYSEDYQFCLDATAAGFSNPIVDLSLGCWHVDNDGWANFPEVGEPEYSATFTGNCGAVSNQYGYFWQGVTKPVAYDNAQLLGCEFTHGWARCVTVKREKKL